MDFEAEQDKPTTQADHDRTAFGALRIALARLDACKPNDRSPKDRYYAVAITDLEKVLAYVKTYVVGDEVGR